MKNIFTILLSFVTILTSAQLATNSSVTPTNLVQNTLLGNGVNAYNITYTGHPDAIGYFDGNNCNIGLSSGIIMTTGTVLNQTSLFGSQEGPFGPNDDGGAGVDNSRPGDAQLETLTGGIETYNAAVLEFDFEATGSIASFNYVFASEEYIEYVNDDYNDVFAFWISGPGITGSQNIALIPGTSIPVAINNLNHLSYSSYYVNNGDGNSSPQNSSTHFVQYDGFTTVLTASTAVECGEVYHIKIAIGDAGDGIFDSGVFLEAQSFTSVAPIVVNSQEVTEGNLANNQLLEGCSHSTITFTRADFSTAETYDLTYTGSALNGSDYMTLPPTISFAAGQNTASITLQTIHDLISEVSENVIITLTYSGQCGQQSTLMITLQIIDQTPLELTMPDDEEISCLVGGSATLEAIVTGGSPDYVYAWSTGENTSSIEVSPTSETTYILTITDDCGIQSVVDSTTITVQAFTALTIQVSNDTTIYCPNSPVDLIASASGGAGNLSYLWTNTAETTENITVESLENQYFVVTASDECDHTISDSILITVVSPLLETISYGDTTICPFDNATIGVYAYGGFGNYRYEWDIDETTEEVEVSTENTQYFYVNVYDDCNTYFIRDSVLVTTSKPTADFIASPNSGVEDKPLHLVNQSQNAVLYFWDLGNEETSTLTDPQTIYSLEGDYLISLIAFNQLGCSDTTSKYIKIHPAYFGYVPNAFSPNNDNLNDSFKGSFIGIIELELQIFNRWGDLIYESDGLRAKWDGTQNGIESPIDVYIYKYKLRDYSNETHEYIGHVNLIR